MKFNSMPFRNRPTSHTDEIDALKAQIQELKAQLDAARNALDGRLGDADDAVKFACEEYVRSEDQLPERFDTEDYCLSNAVKTLVEELDAAQKACAEMRQLLSNPPSCPFPSIKKRWNTDVCGPQEHPNEITTTIPQIDWWVRDNLPSPCGVCPACEFRKRTEHALSTDCGKDYHHVSQFQPLVEALRVVDDWDDKPGHPTTSEMLAAVRAALHHAQSLAPTQSLICPKCGHGSYLNHPHTCY